LSKFLLVNSLNPSRTLIVDAFCEPVFEFFCKKQGLESTPLVTPGKIFYKTTNFNIKFD
jgi:hypothetical protein